MSGPEKVASLAQKRRGMDLSTLFYDPSDPRRQSLIDSFTLQLEGYLEIMLNPDTGDQTALWTRAKAMGVIETLEEMGQTMGQINEIAAKASQQKIRSSLGL